MFRNWPRCQFPFPLLLTSCVHCLFPYFPSAYVSVFCSASGRKSIRTARWSVRRDQSFQLCITSGTLNVNRRYQQQAGKKGLTLARNGLRGTSALGETFGWGHGLVWDLSRRLDHLLSLLGAPVIFCLMSSPACGRGRKVEGGLSPGWEVVASVHLLSFMIAIVVSSVHGISAPSVFILALNLLPRCSRPRWLC